MNPDIFRQCEVVKYHCYACPIGCGGICTTSGKFSETHKPEYETVLALGGLCLNEDADSIFYLNELLNRAGMDSISAGGTVAFAIECFEKGLLTTADTDGLELSWGDTDVVVALIEKMVDGRLRKYYEEVCLLDQTFVIDGETKVSKAVEAAAGEVGGPVEIAGFVRFQLGEGIEKEETDFAAEVAATAGG